MENIRTTAIGFIALVTIIGAIYVINFKALIIMGLIIAGIIGIISLAFLAFMVGELLLNVWRKIRGAD